MPLATSHKPLARLRRRIARGLWLEAGGCTRTDRHPLCVSRGMERTTTILLASIGFFSMGFSQTTNQGESIQAASTNEVFRLRSVNHNAFQAGEKLTYVVHYGWVNAGLAIVELKESD